MDIINVMRQEQQFEGEFAKNKQFEQYMTWMNDALADKAQSIPSAADQFGESFPTLHVIGAPRSGTTLLTQLISTHLEIGYINNLIATFWKAPIFGIHLSKKLLGLRYNSNLSSQYGRTNSIHEPHEFGYFWNFWLRYPDFQQRGIEHEIEVDWKGLSKQLTDMTYAFNLPILFKSFLLGFHSKKMHAVLPKTCFILVERDPIHNATSILKMRKTLVGSIENWVSMRPLTYNSLKSRSPYEQVMGQVLYLQRDYEKQLSAIPESNKISVRYEEVCENPQIFLQKVQRMLTAQGVEVQLRDLPLPKLVNSESISDNEALSYLEEALTKIKLEIGKGAE